MNQSPSQTTHLFTNRQITAMLLPLMAEQLLITLMGMVNTFMVAHVGSYAISAVSLVDSINILVIQAFYALSTGGTIVCAQYLGQKKTGHAIRSAEQTLFIVTLISLVTAAFCILFDRQILRLIFGTVDEEVFNSARTYFFYSSLSYPFIALYDAGSSIFRAQKNTGFPMAMSLIANIANVIGNIILVLILGQGVAGAAISTLAARALCALLVLLRLVKPRENQPVYVANYTRIRPHMPLIRRILHIGIPAGIENSMFQFGKLAIQSSVSTLGVTAMAAHAMASNFESFNGIAGIGVGIGLMTVTGHCLGAGRKDEAVYYVKKFCVAAESAVAGSCILLILLARPCHPFRHGARKHASVSGTFDLHHPCKTDHLGTVLHTRLWPEGRRRCKIYHGRFLSYHVAVPGVLMYFSHPRPWRGPYRRVDRYVLRLDREGNLLYKTVYEQKMAGVSCALT